MKDSATTFSDFPTKAMCALGRWRAIRVVAGVVVIVAIVFMVGTAVVALSRDADAARAMKVPFAVALGFSIVFVRSVRRIRMIESSLAL